MDTRVPRFSSLRKEWRRFIDLDWMMDSGCLDWHWKTIEEWIEEGQRGGDYDYLPIIEHRLGFGD